MKDFRILTLLFLAHAVISILAFARLVQADASLTTLQALQRIRPHVTDSDEAPRDRVKRLSVIASSIEDATESQIERAALISLGRHESHFSKDVCEGARLGDKGKAYGCWQSHDTDRSGGVARQALRAIRDLRRGGNYCRARGYDYLTGAFSIYATGRKCDWPGAAARVKYARNLAWRLR